MAEKLLRDYNILGRKKSKKERKRAVLADNKARGKIGQDFTEVRYVIGGYETKKTGRGSDFRAIRRDPLTGKIIESKLVEVKTGGAKLSKLQKKTRRKKKGKYVVEHGDLPF